MPTTIRDVATAAGVSPATVSRVLSGRQDVNADLAARVRQSVMALNYRPNGLARSLRRRATTVLGMIISDVTNPFFTTMVRGVEDVAQAAGYSVVLANSDEDLGKEARYLEVAAAEQFAGVVLSPASASRTDVGILQEYNIPVVTVDRRLRSPDVDSIAVNNRKAAKDATLHLVADGCRRTAMVAGPRETSTARDRLAGYRDALRMTKVGRQNELVVYGDFRIEGGYARTKELLKADPPPDGLLISNNLMTIGALEALAESGLSYPEDVAVVGFDDMPFLPESSARLSSISQPTHEIGRRAVEILLQRIRGEPVPRQHVVLRATLIVGRNSSRSAGGARPPRVGQFRPSQGARQLRPSQGTRSQAARP